MDQLNSLARLNFTGFIPRGAEPANAGTIDIETQFDIVAKAFLHIIGFDTISVRAKRGWGKYAWHSPRESRWWRGKAKILAKRPKSRSTRAARFINKDIED